MRVSSAVPLSGSFAIIVVEQAAQARACFDDALVLSHVLFCMNDTVIHPLMVSLCMVVLHILLDREAKMLLSQEDDLVQTLGLDAGRAADKTKRSANAFRFGLRAGNRTGFVPLSFSMPLKKAVYSGSLSMIRYPALRKKPSNRSVRLRAICFIQASQG